MPRYWNKLADYYPPADEIVFVKFDRKELPPQAAYWDGLIWKSCIKDVMDETNYLADYLANQHLINYWMEIPDE